MVNCPRKPGVAALKIITSETMTPVGFGYKRFQIPWPIHTKLVPNGTCKMINVTS